MPRPIHDDIETTPPRIETFERRLALSASIAGDLLIDVLGSMSIGSSSIASSSIGPPAAPSLEVDPTPEVQSSLQPPPAAIADTDVAPNLIQQAADLRASRGLGGAGQTVAVIDSGIAYDHIAFGGGFGPGYRVVGGWDFAENDADPYDDGPVGFHGTHVSGLLAGATNDYTGVAPDADLVALRVFDDNGSGQLQWIESALRWVYDNQDAFESPITTVNLSIGAALNDANRDAAIALLEDELALLRQSDILVFAAAGNFFDGGDGNTGVLFPASSPSVVAVGSIDDDGMLSRFSQRESDVLATHGRSILGAVPDHVFGLDGNVDDFARLDGTSQATPQIAGASILVRQSLIEQGLTPTADDVLNRIRETSIERIDPITGQAYRTIDLAAAVAPPLADDGLQAVAPEPAPEPAPELAPEPAPDSSSPPVDRFDGDDDGDRYELDLRDGIVLRIGGVAHPLTPSLGDATVTIDAFGGADSISILGGPESERLIAHALPGQTSELSTNTFRIQLRGFEQIEFNGGGGFDRATFFDSAGSDTLESRPGAATLSGTGFRFDAIDVSSIFVHGINGGRDTAFLQDSSGNDSLSVRPGFTSLRSDDSFQLAYGFEQVYAYATAGGFDTAELFDSAGDDVLSVSAGRTLLTGPGYQVSASGFDSTTGHANAGGNDIARIYADETGSSWETTADRIQWTGADGAVRIARSFETNEALQRSSAFERFAPVDLLRLSIHDEDAAWQSPLWSMADAKSRIAAEADAARQVFAELGDD